MKMYSEILKKHYWNKQKLLTFVNLVEDCKKRKFSFENLSCVLQNSVFFEELFKNDAISVKDLEYLWDNITEWFEVRDLSDNRVLLKKYLELSKFNEFIDKRKKARSDTPYAKRDADLSELLQDTELIDFLFNEHLMSKQDLRYLLNAIDDSFELETFCCNTKLVKEVLNSFLVDVSVVEKFDALIEAGGWYGESGKLFGFFNVLKHFSTHYYDDGLKRIPKEDIDEELLRLIELTEKIYVLNNFEFGLSQKLQTLSLCESFEICQLKLKEIVENHLENNYDFDSLMNYLKKSEKKNLLNI